MDYKPAIASMSLGRAWVHELQPKLDQASKQAFQGIEIFYEDLEYLAKSLPDGLTDSNTLSAAKLIKTLCIERNLEIIGLQPFMHYEGLLDPVEHANRIKKLHLWFQVVKILDTNTIQIPTNFLTEGITGDHEILVRDLREVADLGLKEVPPVRFAYENLCWGTFIDTWKGAWSLVTAVDRKNFGMCLDTFNIAGREWADPAAPSGTIPNADAVLDASLEEMVRTVDVNKVFYVQVVDAERLSSPLGPGHEFYVESQPARMSWSRNARLFPFEDGAYLPILKVLRAITEGLGYKGWISMELFSRTMADPRPECPSEHAERGIKAFRRLVQEMGWEVGAGAGAAST